MLLHYHHRHHHHVSVTVQYMLGQEFCFIFCGCTIKLISYTEVIVVSSVSLLKCFHVPQRELHVTACNTPPQAVKLGTSYKIIYFYCSYSVCTLCNILCTIEYGFIPFYIINKYSTVLYLWCKVASFIL